MGIILNIVLLFGNKYYAINSGAWRDVTEFQQIISFASKEFEVGTVIENRRGSSDKGGKNNAANFGCYISLLNRIIKSNLTLFRHTSVLCQNV